MASKGPQRRWQAGDRVDFNGGFPGVVVRRYSEGMVEVRGDRGMVCIPDEDCTLPTRCACGPEQPTWPGTDKCAACHAKETRKRNQQTEQEKDL